MERGTGDRGVSEVVGFILLFGMLVIAFTVYQGIVVPDQNRQVEFQHNQEVHGQLQDLRNAIVTTASTGSGQAVSVTLGATYPRRTIAQNLGVSGGSLQTTETGSGSVRVGNARAIEEETADYLDGTQRAFETRTIRYTPVYSFYSNAPQTIYENSLVYNRFGGANVTLTDQSLIDGRRITLIVVNGSLTRTQRDTVSVGTEAISASANRVAVRNTTGERVNVTIPTRLSAARWTEILSDEMDGDGHVEAVTDVPGEAAVNISMEAGVTYELRMAKIGVGDATSDEGPEYVTAIEGDDTSVPEGGTRKLVAEVRDRFNNPVSNVSVSASNPTQGSVSPATERTDVDGRVAFVYSAPADVGGAQDVDIDVSFDGGGTPSKSLTFDVRVIDSDGSGGGGGGDDSGTDEINPAESGDIHLKDEQLSPSKNALLTFENTGSTVNVTHARVSFVYDAQGGGIQDAEISESGGPVSATLVVGDKLTPLSPEIELPGSNTETEILLDFNENLQSDDFFVLTLQYSDGEVGTYFVGLQ